MSEPSSTMERAIQAKQSEVRQSPTEKYREYLTTRGKRFTREQRIIVEEVFSHHEHFDADEIISRLALRRDGRRVSRATIYRSLASLEEAGLLRRVARQDDKEIWEHDYGYPQHDHLICRRCGKLVEFVNSQVQQLLRGVAEEHGFRMEGHRLEVQGLCRECSRPPESRPKKLNLL